VDKFFLFCRKNASFEQGRVIFFTGKIVILDFRKNKMWPRRFFMGLSGCLENFQKLPLIQL
jgi:hypothetical protein